jgi:glycosyltransferase involved in cell wall biosynthesis
MSEEIKNNQEPLRIAYLIPRFHPFRGGAERNIEAMAERMVKEGHDVTVITTDVKFRNETLSKREEYKGIKIVRVHALNKSLYAGFYPELLPFLLRNDFDVIHSSGIGFLWREVCLIIRKVFKKKTKYINTPHGPFMALGDRKGFRGFAKRWYTRILRLFLNRLYDVFIEVNPKQYAWMEKEYKIDNEKVKLVPNGIDESYIEKEIVEHSKKDEVIITYMNRMHWYKGMQDVVRAIGKIKKSKSKLATELPPFQFYIMGRPTDYLPKLKEIITEEDVEEYVKFILSPTDEERDEIFYKESQINILPSKWEATGIVLIEAMAKGNAIITTSGNEAADILIEDGENGFVYDFTDIDALARILTKLLGDYEMRQTMRQKNLEKSKEFTWDSVFPKYLEIIKELA